MSKSKLHCCFPESKEQEMCQYPSFSFLKLWGKQLQYQPWVFLGRNDAKAETPVLWPPHAKSWLIGKDSDAGRDWGKEEKGTTEDEMAWWHHRLDGREFEWTLGDGDGQGGLACCNSWGCKESDTTERLNWTELQLIRMAYAKIFTLKFNFWNYFVLKNLFKKTDNFGLCEPLWWL